MQAIEDRCVCHCFLTVRRMHAADEPILPFLKNCFERSFLAVAVAVVMAEATRIHPRSNQIFLGFCDKPNTPSTDLLESGDMPFLKYLSEYVATPLRLLLMRSSMSFTGEILSYTACRQLSQMFLAVAFFHSSEYILAVAFHGRSNVTLKSLLISKNYLLAMIFSLLEYVIEIVLFPGLKEHWWISDTGLALVVIGEIIRKSAIITAGRAFTHLIKVHHEEHHRLITHGIYRFVRHPGYSGFLIWSVGTQIMLCNPISTIAFAIVVWKFFAERIPYEEYFLKRFFGSEYEEYARRIPSGVPFVK
ncbi:hypothetical protein V6N12_005066 [Hibiscus sabdariffa]|uniref:Protein-S-isoprenylcysteine O-methyltransferase n=1 Tax=Hibiscus sabdariffa TaxID=183260 RepID=A0ABR2CNE8_9ROSI